MIPLYRTLRRVARRAVKPAYLALLERQHRYSQGEHQRLTEMHADLPGLISAQSARQHKIDQLRKEVSAW